MMRRGALDACGLSVFRNPHHTPYSVTIRALRVVAQTDYFFVSPFFLLSVKIFFPDFFLCVHVVRTDDLHLLQFLTKPALNEHINVYLLFVFR
jgi:hypothetical protein